MEVVSCSSTAASRTARFLLTERAWRPTTCVWGLLTWLASSAPYCCMGFLLRIIVYWALKPYSDYDGSYIKCRQPPVLQGPGGLMRGVLGSAGTSGGSGLGLELRMSPVSSDTKLGNISCQTKLRLAGCENLQRQWPLVNGT